MALDSASPLAGVEGPSQAGPSTPQVPAVLAEVDLLIERADLGPGCHTVVVAGQRIPPHLARLPSRPYVPSVMTSCPAAPKVRRGRI